MFLYSELRCYDSFVHEFLYSSLAARVIYALPIVLDAVAVVGLKLPPTKPLVRQY